MIRYIYSLEHIPEITDKEEINVKLLGIFTSRKQVNKAIKRYRELPGFSERKEVFDGEEYKEGFFISRTPIGMSYWEGGFTIIGTIEKSYMNQQVQRDIEIALNLPYWFKDEQDPSDKSSIYLAERLMQEKYNTFDYPRGPQSELYQIKKFRELNNK